MRVDAGTVSFGATGDGASVSGSVVIGGSGMLGLSSVAGGDLNVGGDWVNGGTFNSNGRQVAFTGSGAQSIGGTAASTFDYLLIDNSGTGVATLSHDITVRRQLKINDSDAELVLAGLFAGGGQVGAWPVERGLARARSTAFFPAGSWSRQYFFPIAFSWRGIIIIPVPIVQENRVALSPGCFRRVALAPAMIVFWEGA